MHGHARLFLGGDLMTGRGVDQIQKHPSDPRIDESYVRDARGYVELAAQRNGPVPRDVDPTYIWGDALGALERVQARIVNLETSVTQFGKHWPGKGIQYRMHPRNVACLTAARIDVCALANNHVLDWQRPGLIETLDTLRAAGIAVAGAGRDVAEARSPAVVRIAEDQRVIVFSLGTASSGIPREWAAATSRPGVNLVELVEVDVAEIAARMGEARRRGDVVVASIHWGSNWGLEIPDAHVRFAHRLIDAGVDIVHGHSSHHPRGVEVYEKKLVLYGCGELLDDYEGIGCYEMFRGDLVLLYFVDVSAEDGALRDLVMTPMRIRRMRLERASPAETAWLAEALEAASARFGPVIDIDDEGNLVLRSLHGRAAGVRPMTR